ncbi:PepSY domain-containing protein [Colwellia sp. MB02u-9]|uniref:PepSY-associated TM helix domain-containing protein n=1 Tax=Colwellia sp. MB02u-9 TaxID=2759823 RepID=UPI0015F3E7E2|nr:PepSY-associated TM helix domain-containing protein [Colwellia sp. MB02u-9]MBA6296080.1 PepSY domain-containing protein [Colwellia sp. MB02u-9]
MNKKQWSTWHSLVGIKLAILSCFILITGTFAVISHEIDWLANSSQRVLPSVSSVDINWPKIYRAANQQNATQIVSINAPIDDWFAVEVLRLDNNGERYRQFYHPVTGDYQGEGRWLNWQRFFRMSHRHLMLPTTYGITIVCIVGLVLFFSLISGFFIIPKWWKGFFKKPRTNNSKTFWNDCHRLFGLWSSWLLLTVCITGIWYLIEVWGGRANFPEQKTPENSVNKLVVSTTTSVFEKVINSVGQYHDLTIKRIVLPSIKAQTIIVEGQNDTLLVRNRANNVIFDGLTGNYLSRRMADKQSLHVRISEAADPLHFGIFGGIYTKILYFSFGATLCALAISGTYLYGLRQYKSKRGELNIAKKVWKKSWHGTGHWKWLSLMLIAAALTLALLTFSNTTLSKLLL